MEWFKGIVAYIKKQTKNKLIENAIIIIIIGVIVIIAGSTFFSGGQKKEKDASTPDGSFVEAAKRSAEPEDMDELNEKLSTILSKIKGAGKVDVMITYSAGTEQVPAYDIKENGTKTLEKDKEGGTRDIDQNEQEKKIVYEDQQGGLKRPLILKNLQPIVKGVVVAAEGAGDPTVREAIIRAVQALTDVPMHKVQVFEHSKN